jgi:hypothetical protein
MICDPNSLNVAMLSDVSCRHTHRRLTNVLTDPTRALSFAASLFPIFRMRELVLMLGVCYFFIAFLYMSFRC